MANTFIYQYEPTMFGFKPNWNYYEYNKAGLHSNSAVRPTGLFNSAKRFLTDSPKGHALVNSVVFGAMGSLKQGKNEGELDYSATGMAYGAALGLTATGVTRMAMKDKVGASNYYNSPLSKENHLWTKSFWKEALKAL